MPRLIDSYDAFAVDLDGVVWRGSEPVAGAAEAMSALRRAEKRVLFFTNNALNPPGEVARRLQAIEIEAAEAEVLTSGVVARRWIAEQGLGGAAAFLLGPGSFVEQFRDLVEVVPISVETEVSLVLVARDVEFSFERLHAASRAVRRGAVLVGVNRDPAMPVPGGVEPGTGAIVAAIEAASGAGAVILGKPEAPMMNAAAEILGDSRVLMIGDQPSSDVLGARRAGWDAALVLSGVSDGEEAGPPADFTLSSLGSLLKEPVRPH